MSWKRSAGGTSIVSTMARWIASPTCRRYSGALPEFLPLASEMRTSGMGAFRVGEDAGEQATQRLSARPACRELEGQPELRVVAIVLHGVSHEALLYANDTAALPPSALTSARPP